MSEQPTDTLIRTLKSPREINSTTLLGVCASLKPAPGYPSRSAARSLLFNALDTVATIYPDTHLLDLRDYPPPFFDGRMPEKYDDASLQFVRECIERAGALLLSVPAYWSSVSGVFKNFIDVSCGPLYDMDSFTTIFTNKFVGLVVVGADEASAHAGADQARQIMLSTGANVVSNPIVVPNPRSLGPALLEGILQEVIATGADLARHILQAKENTGVGKK